MVGEMAQAGQDMGAELDVVAQLDQSEGAVEVLARDCVVAGVVRHPAGHLGQSRGCRKEVLVSSALAAAEETGTNLGVQIADDGAVQVATSDPLVGRAERVHGGRVSVRVSPCAVVEGKS